MRKALWVATVPIAVVLLQLLWLAFPLPGSRILHAICLPTDWTCALNDRGAMVSSANAAWWLILATSSLAGATLAAVVVALGQDRRRARADDMERTRINRAAKQAILNTYGYCRTVENAIRGLTKSDPDLAWDFYGVAEAHRRTLEHYLGTMISNDVIVYQCNAAIQRLHEVRTALDWISINKPTDVNEAKSVLGAVIPRIDKDEPEVMRAGAEVVDGVTRLVAEARGSASGSSNTTGKSST